LDHVGAILEETLLEEGDTNKRLNTIALQSVNPEAADATREDKTLREAVVAVLEASR
jgi:hypothetical protein